MTPMIWKPEYAIHDDRVDSQHQSLFDLFNRVCKADPGSVDQERLIHDLYAYAVFHFAEEEALMATEHYPKADFERHRQCHTEFFAAIQRLRHEPLDSLLRFFQDWLVQHILTDDRAIGEFLIASATSNH